VNCTCPVCELTAQYPAEYEGKWHRCQAGCAGNTRLLLVPEGVGVTEAAVAASWEADTLTGRVQRGALAVAAIPLVLAPLASSGNGALWLMLLAVSGVAAAALAGSAHAAWVYRAPKPPGL
jgi:hypothetical protein